MNPNEFGKTVYLLFLLPLLSCASLLAAPCEESEETVWTTKSFSIPSPPSPRYGIGGEKNQNPILYVPDPARTLHVPDLLDIALHNNPTTHKAWTDARAAYYGYESAKSICYPQVNVTEKLQATDISSVSGNSRASSAAAAAGAGTALGQLSGGGFAPGSNQSLTSDLLISYLLFDFGGREATIASARQNWYSIYWLYDQATQTTMMTVLQNYYQYATTKALIVAKKKDVENYQSSYDSSFAAYQAGVKTHVDALLAKSALLNQELQLVQLQGQLKVNLGNLDASLGLSPDTVITVQEIPETLPEEKVTLVLEDLKKTALTARPDLASADAYLAQKRADYVTSISNGLPNMTANGDLQYTRFFNNPALSGHSYTGNIQLNIPLFSGFFYTNQIRQANQLVQSAYNMVQATETQVLLEVVTAYYNFITADESLRISREYLAATKESYESIDAGYRLGTTSILDLLAAQSSLADARSQVVQARTQWSIALVNLGYATGTLTIGGVP